MTTFSVTQSGKTVQITSTAAGFTQNSANQYYLNSGNLSSRTDSFSITFDDGASIRLTDFSEIPFNSAPSSANTSVLGIPSAAENGFTNSVNLIGGFGYFSSFDVYDNISGRQLIDDYRPQGDPGGTSYFSPYAQFGYDSGSLTIRAPRATADPGDLVSTIDSQGQGTFPTPIGSYLGGASGTSANQYVSGGAGSAWVFSLDVPAPICFVERTLIGVQSGTNTRIEDLAIGDWITTSRGMKKVKWVAKKHYSPSIIKLFPQILPIRFKAGSIATNIPSIDLLVSRKHGMFINGKAVGAASLANGISIERCQEEDFPNGITYYHLEFEEAEIIRANGALSTTFFSVGNRSEFDNAFEYQTLYGDLDAHTRHDYPLMTNDEIRRLRHTLLLRAAVNIEGNVSGNQDFTSATFNKSPIPQSSTVTILDARSNDSADAALSSVRATQVMAVTATPA